jgi:hypothetical protein
MKHVIVGILVTAIGFFGAFLSAGSHVGRILYWQGYLLQNLIPAPNLGDANNPRFEATPLHIVAFFLGLPIGIVFYSLLSYLIANIPRFIWRQDRV